MHSRHITVSIIIINVLTELARHASTVQPPYLGLREYGRGASLSSRLTIVRIPRELETFELLLSLNVLLQTYSVVK
jgi:hypothetical protein